MFELGSLPKFAWDSSNRIDGSNFKIPRISLIRLNKILFAVEFPIEHRSPLRPLFFEDL